VGVAMGKMRDTSAGLKVWGGGQVELVRLGLGLVGQALELSVSNSN